MGSALETFCGQAYGAKEYHMHAEGYASAYAYLHSYINTLELY